MTNPTKQSNSKQKAKCRFSECTDFGNPVGYCPKHQYLDTKSVEGYRERIVKLLTRRRGKRRFVKLDKIMEFERRIYEDGTELERVVDQVLKLIQEAREEERKRSKRTFKRILAKAKKVNWGTYKGFDKVMEQGMNEYEERVLKALEAKEREEK